jgi:hypothetical protein
MGMNFYLQLTSYFFCSYVISQHILLITREYNDTEEDLRKLCRNSSDTTFETQERKKVLQDELRQLQRCVATLKNTLSSVQVMDAVQPVRLMGIKCEGRTAVMIVYTLFLALLAILQYAYSGNISA